MSREITGLVIARNEAPELPVCLQTWSEVCDDLIVVDNESTDDTREIARSFGAKIVDACMDDETGFAGLRNTGLEAVQTSDVLVFDADEIPTTTLLGSIAQAVATRDENQAYRVQRRNAAFGGWLDHGRFSPDWQTRLFSSSTRYSGVVHEVPDLTPSTRIVDLDGKIEHRTYASVQEYITKMNLYAQKQSLHNNPPSLIHMLGRPVYDLIAREGYKDGWRGWAMALGEGWHEHLLRQYSRNNHQLPVGEHPPVAVAHATTQR